MLLSRKSTGQQPMPESPEQKATVGKSMWDLSGLLP